MFWKSFWRNFSFLLNCKNFGKEEITACATPFPKRIFWDQPLFSLEKKFLQKLLEVKNLFKNSYRFSQKQSFWDSHGFLKVNKAGKLEISFQNYQEISLCLILVQLVVFHYGLLELLPELLLLL
jgi:hypothetical protein